jgi:hypothetical protein
MINPSGQDQIEMAASAHGSNTVAQGSCSFIKQELAVDERIDWND